MPQINSHTKHYWNTFDRKVKQFNKPAQLPEYFAEMIEGKDTVYIAEVCCGLVNTIGDSWPDKKIYVTCSDSNADSFNSMWEEKGITPLHPIKKENIEELHYYQNLFDVVHCRNALDHTEDPLRAISELKRVSREWVYLLHAPDQMSTYGGHHKWDIRLEDGKTVFYGKEYSFILNGFKSYLDKDGLIVSIWKK